MGEMLTSFINALLSTQAHTLSRPVWRPEPGAVQPRNGYRRGDLDTRVGTVNVAVPKLREGSFIPDWLLQRRRRAEVALTTVVATYYLLGASTRRMDQLGRSLGVTGMSKSQVSVPARRRCGEVAAPHHPRCSPYRSSSW